MQQPPPSPWRPISRAPISAAPWSPKRWAGSTRHGWPCSKRAPPCPGGSSRSCSWPSWPCATATWPPPPAMARRCSRPIRATCGAAHGLRRRDGRRPSRSGARRSWPRSRKNCRRTARCSVASPASIGRTVPSSGRGRAGHGSPLHDPRIHGGPDPIEQLDPHPLPAARRRDPRLPARAQRAGPPALASGLLPGTWASIASWCSTTAPTTARASGCCGQGPDVHLFQTEASFAASGAGMRWTNRLLDAHGIGAWCLTIDADEVLVYPHCETAPLPVLTAYLDRCGAEAMVAPMLDLYAEVPLDEVRYAPGAEPDRGVPLVRRHRLRPSRQQRLPLLPPARRLSCARLLRACRRRAGAAEGAADPLAAGDQVHLEQAHRVPVPAGRRQRRCCSTSSTCPSSPPRSAPRWPGASISWAARSIAPTSGAWSRARACPSWAAASQRYRDSSQLVELGLMQASPAVRRPCPRPRGR